MSEKCDPEHYSVGEKTKICCKNHRDMTIERLPPVAKICYRPIRVKNLPVPRHVINKINRGPEEISTFHRIDPQKRLLLRNR